MRRVWGTLALWVVFFLLYLVLVGTTDKWEIIAGLIISFIVAYGLSDFTLSFGETKLTLGGILLFIFIYIPYFIYAMILANLDVAYRVLHPARPIAPGIVKFKTKLKSPLGKLILANSITLTPGTITVEVKDDTYYIHWIDAETTDPEDAKEKICGTFERLLLNITG